MWTIVEVIYGFEGILICSDRTQCEVCFENSLALSLSLFESLCLSPALLSASLPVLWVGMGTKLWDPVSRLSLGSETPFKWRQWWRNSLHSDFFFLMTMAAFIMSVTLEGCRCAPLCCHCFVQTAFWYFVPVGIWKYGYLLLSFWNHNRLSRSIAQTITDLSGKLNNSSAPLVWLCNINGSSASWPQRRGHWI